MNEGITSLNGRVYLGFESAAYTYNHDPSDVPINRVPRVHSADRSIGDRAVRERPDGLSGSRIRTGSRNDFAPVGGVA